MAAPRLRSLFVRTAPTVALVVGLLFASPVGQRREQLMLDNV